ncbi:ACT domain protein [Planctomycetes bacterium CA13]|uniref:ACT domain protein n=1 Tax=Novipirellula herctigrandis TaxID=2527986 RepID=A0A5C5Z5L6_9BACT|nr:ACT domain protein [Planctomycetes bacterium CA13]
MSGITDLRTLLASLKPVLVDGEFVFVSRPLGKYGDGVELNPIATFAENEGLTLVIPKDRADAAGEQYCGIFRMITLQVHSSLEAVGLTATVANILAKRGISTNLVAAFYHDHLFVPSSRPQDAIDALTELMSQVELES